MKKINKTFIEKEITESYLNYAMSVIIGRALPDVRDGLKPVHRRILFVMKELNNFNNKNYKKSARIVGDVIGKYHPHGENAVYESIVRMTQMFVQRYPLIEGQGNFGSIDGDPAAAMRYTEIKMSKITEYLIKDLNFDTVHYTNNYDNTSKYPTIFPNIYPNLLINGSCGIAVGMATNMPPHNIKNAIDSCVAYINNKNITIDDLIKIIKAPDFPTKGCIYGYEEIIKAYKTGKGKIIIRANIIIENINDKTYIIINELPYQTNKVKIIEKIINLNKEKKIDGIKLIRDESDKDGLRIAIEIIKGKNPKIIINNLYKQTKLQNTFNVNMIALVENKPKILNLKTIITLFVEHRNNIIVKRSNYIINKLKNKFHKIEGLTYSINNIKNILNIITKTKKINQTKNKIKHLTLFLKKKYKKNCGAIIFNLYKLSKKQTENILNLKLNNLVKKEKFKILREYIVIIKDIFYFKLLIKNKNKILETIKKELIFIKNKFADERKTKIIEKNKIITNNDLIIKEKIIIILSNNNYIKFQLLSNYNIQKRKTRGKLGISLKHSDSIKKIIISNTHNNIILISNIGKIYLLNLNNITISKKATSGIPIINLIKIEKNEIITTIIDIDDINKYTYLIMITKKGLIKKIKTQNIKKNGTKIISNKNEIICEAMFINENEKILISSSSGKSIKINSNDIRCTNKQSRGIIGIKIKKNEFVTSMCKLHNYTYILSITEKGFGKKTHIKNYALTKRANKGSFCIKTTSKTGNLIKTEPINDNNDLLLITNNGIILRINAKNIPCSNRYTKGVLLIKLKEKEKLTDIKGDNNETMYNN